MSNSMRQDQTRSWWSQNWKWFLPVGCLGSLVLIGGSFFGLIFTIFSFMKSSGAVQGALARAQASPRAIDALGEPIEMGWWMSGSISVSGPSGEAELSIPLSGPRGSGTLYIVAKKNVGQWEYELLELVLDDSNQRIDLLSTGSLVLNWQLLPLASDNPVNSYVEWFAAPEVSGSQQLMLPFPKRPDVNVRA